MRDTPTILYVAAWVVTWSLGHDHGTYRNQHISDKSDRTTFDQVASEVELTLDFAENESRRQCWMLIKSFCDMKQEKMKR